MYIKLNKVPNCQNAPKISMQLAGSVDMFNDMLSSEIAAQYGDEQKLMQLSSYHINNGFLFKMHGNDHLQNACLHKKLTLVQYFLKMGADVNYRNLRGRSCMHFVMLQSGPETAELTFKTCKLIDLLVRLGMSVSVRAFTGKTVLHQWAFDKRSAFASHDYHQKILDRLLAHDAPLNVVDHKGNTALMHTAKNSSGRFMVLLTATMDRKDINLDQRNYAGNSCAHLLAKQKLERRINFDGIDDSRNAHALRLLLSRGVSLSLTNNDGQTVIESIVTATEKNDALRKVLYDHTVDCMIAFLMGGHRKLGSRSYVQHLDEVVLDLVMCDFKERLKLIGRNATHGTDTTEFANALLAVKLGHNF